VALHAGATAALLIAWRRALIDELQALEARELGLLALASAPAALAGYVFQDQIELHLGQPRIIAAALIVGAAAMAAADRKPEARNAEEAGAGDALWLGGAQACALVPGVSRQGATLAAARLRQFKRDEAATLARRLAFPVIIGATTLKGWRLRRGRLDPGSRAPILAGTAMSFVSTLFASRVARDPTGGRALWPYALYRLGLAAAILARAGRGNLEGPFHDQGHGQPP